MAKPVPSRGSDQFVVRFPEGMRDNIKNAAEINGRSMNAEIVARLEEYPQLQDTKLAYHQAIAVQSTLEAELNRCRQKLDDYKLLVKFAEEQLEAAHKAPRSDEKSAITKKLKPLTEEEKEELWVWLQENIRPKQ